MSILSDSLNKWYSKSIDEPAIVQSPAATETAQKPDTGQTIYDMVKEYGKPYSYEQELREAERNRKLGMLNDFIKSATDFGSALAGRRMFSNTESATKQANDRFDKIRDLQRQGAINYQNALLNARLKDAEIARNEAQRKAQLDLQREQMGENNRRWNEQMAYTKERDKANDAWRMYQLNNQNEQGEKNRQFQAAQSEKSRNFQKEMYDQKQTNTLTKGNDYVEFVGANGRKTVLSKSASQAFVPVVFSNMRELAAGKDNLSTNEKLAFNITNKLTTEDKATIVRELLPKFPELQQWVEQMEVLNRMYPNATPDEWNKILRGEDPSIKTWSPDMEQKPKQEEKKEQDYILFDPNETSESTDWRSQVNQVDQLYKQQQEQQREQSNKAAQEERDRLNKIRDFYAKVSDTNKQG